MLSFNVLGTPAPKGSSRAILIKGRAVNVPGGSNTNRTQLKSWDVSVRAAAAFKLGKRDEPLFLGKPLHVELQFRLQRPAGHWGTKGLKPSAPIAPATKPDIDKLVRATLDSMNGLVFDDDSRIVRLLVTKTYAAPGQDGAFIHVCEYDPAIVVTFSKQVDDEEAAA